MIQITLVLSIQYNHHETTKLDAQHGVTLFSVTHREKQSADSTARFFSKLNRCPTFSSKFLEKAISLNSFEVI